MLKFTCSVGINKPKETVVKYFADPQYLVYYQDGFMGKKLISGNDGEEGAISDMFYKFNNQKMVITETVMNNQLPDYFRGLYTHEHMDNFMISRFVSIDEDWTQYEADIEYIEFRKFHIKILAKLFPSMFKKQVQKWLDNFKHFVEEQ